MHAKFTNHPNITRLTAYSGLTTTSFSPDLYFTSSQTLPELGKKLLGKRQLVEDKSNPVKKQATCIALTNPNEKDMQAIKGML
jgi:hypothetical protein